MANKVIILLTASELATIDEARGLMTREAFISHASLQTAEDLLSVADAEERRGSIPTFIHDRIERERHDR